MAVIRQTGNLGVRTTGVRETYADLYTNFDKHPDKLDLLRYINEESVKRSIKNILQTSRGERFFNPTFGSNIRALLFEKVSSVTESLLREYIETSISNFEPRAKLIEVIVSGMPDENAYDVSVIFSTINTTEPITLNLILNRVR